MTFSYPIKVEVEWTVGTWTDVSADVDLNGGCTIKWGRTSPLSQPQPGSVSFTLDNFDGRYTPGRSTLSDGITAAPYYPNVKPRRRVRVSYTVGGTSYPRFLGNITSFEPVSAGGRVNQMQLTAVDLLDRLSRVSLDSPMRRSIMACSPYQYWPLTDAAAIGQGVEQSGASRGNMISAMVAPSALPNSSPVSFEASGPGFGDGTAVQWPDLDSVGGYMGLSGSAVTPGVATIVLWVKPAGQPATSSSSHPWRTIAFWSNSSGSSYAELAINSVTGSWMYAENGTFKANLANINTPGLSSVSSFAQLVVTYSGGNYTIYFNNIASVTGASVLSPSTINANSFALGTYLFFFAVGIAIGQVSTYTYPLSSGQIADQWAAGNGYGGETPSQRLNRYLALGGVAAADYQLDAASTPSLTSYPETDKSVLEACQAIATTEGGGAVFYAGPTKLRFRSRTSRSATPLMTLDAQADLDRGTFSPATDDINLVNRLTVSMADASGTNATQLIADAASIAEFGPISGSGDFTSYSTSPSDAYGVGQAIVTANSQPRFRLPQVGLDLATATNDLWSLAGQVEIGSRLRLTNLPANAAPSSTVDVYIEGATETIKTGSYSIVYDTSPT